MHQSPTHSTHIPQATDKTHSIYQSITTNNEWNSLVSLLQQNFNFIKQVKAQKKESIVFIIDKNHHILPIQWFPANIPII